MEPIILKDILKACDGKFFGDEKILDRQIYEISTNSREIVENTLFVPIVGDKFDGHDFIDNAFKDGCLCALSHKKLNRENYILVEDALKSYRDIAEYYRGLFDVKVIAITGSVGKTTAKEMMASVLSQKYDVLKNEGNFNNEVGLPKTLLNLAKHHEIAVVEMGMNSFGEISRLSKTARPDICIIMNIGDAHIGKLGSREGIFRAKTEIFDYMKKDGQVFLYGNDDMLVALNESDLNPVFFGESSYNHVSVKGMQSSNIEGTEIQANINGELVDIKIPVPGGYMVPSVLCAAAVGKSLGLTDREIQQGVLSYRPAKMRKEIINTGNLTIINDAYNACEDSIIAGLELLELAVGRKAAILGDILEVGEHGERVHYSVGQKAAEKNVDIIICCGEQSWHTYRGITENSEKKAYYFEDKAKMHQELDKIIKKGDTVLVKASRGCRFEETVEYLKTL
ncbi:MAG: UDP-N-acetylmuramoyl-tripeptide--D-alanyl-D-alanine ligase [Eubacteriales bacterium]